MFVVWFFVAQYVNKQKKVQLMLTLRNYYCALLIGYSLFCCLEIYYYVEIID
jgi:hypothetical protein